MLSNNGIVTTFTPEQEQVFLGTIFGDATLRSPRGRVSNSQFEVKHRELDKEYLFWKYECLKLSGIFKRAPYPRISHLNGKQYPNWTLSSRHLPIFTLYRKLFYPGSRKVVLPELLDKLELLGLAVWYMDDGHLSCFREGVPYPRVWLATMSFTYGENVMIRDWFDDKFGFHFHIYKVDRGARWGLLSGRAGVEKFLAMLRPHAVLCMERKFKVLGGE